MEYLLKNLNVTVTLQDYTGPNPPELYQYLKHLESDRRDFVREGDGFTFFDTTVEWDRRETELRTKLGEDLALFYRTHAARMWGSGGISLSNVKLKSVSPLERYVLSISRHGNSAKAVITKGDVEVATVYRNGPHFPHEWVEDHPTGCDYLVCGEDYQSQSVVNLTTGEIKSLISRDSLYNIGFVWASIEVSPDKTVLAVTGQNPPLAHRSLFVDFSDPMNVPWPQHETDEEWVSCKWIDGKTLEVEVESTVVCLYGHPADGKDWHTLSLKEKVETRNNVKVSLVKKQLTVPF